MILIVGRLQAKTGQAGRFLVFAQDIVARERQVEGCLAFDVLQDVTQPDRFVMIEQWRDRSALDHHLASDAYAQNSARVGSFIEGEGDWAEYEV